MRQFVGRLGVACILVVVVSVGAIAVGDQIATREYAKRTTVHIGNGVLALEAPAQPANLLLLGGDSTGLIAQDKLPDTMMIVHVDPAVPTPVLVSLPRDLVVDIPGHGRGQINAAFALGGAGLLIKTIEVDFQIPIHHYLAVDFTGFQKIVDAIGHVKVWFPTPVHDRTPGSTCHKPAACRSTARRHWHTPARATTTFPTTSRVPPHGSGTTTRIFPRTHTGAAPAGPRPAATSTGSPRQQYFLRTLGQAAINKTADDPFRLLDLLDAVMTNLSTDQHLKLDELKALVRTFRKLKPDQVQMSTLPFEPDPANPNRVVAKYPQALSVIGQLQNFNLPKAPKPLPPTHVSVRVVNGSGIPGLGTRALNAFVAQGFRAGGPAADADRGDYANTQVRYGPGKSLAGYTVAIAVGTLNLVGAVADAGTLGGDVLVVVGRDYNQLQGIVHTSTTPTTPLARTTTNPVQSTTTTTAAAQTSVDSRFVPVNPKTGGPLVGCP